MAKSSWDYTDYGEDAQKIERRRALAQALTNQGLFGADDGEGRMIGKVYVRPSAAKAIQKGFAYYAGKKEEEGASEAAKELTARRREDTQKWMEGAGQIIDEETGEKRPMTRNEMLAHYMKGTELGGPAGALGAAGAQSIMSNMFRKPEYKIEERYNADTGRKEKVWVDASQGPGGVETPFGGQSAESAGLTDAAKKMKELVSRGMDPQIAEGLAYGYLTLGQNADGSTVVINKRSAAQEGGMGGGMGQPQGAPTGGLEGPAGPPQGAPMPAPQGLPQGAPQGPPQGAPSPYQPAGRVPGQVGAAAPSSKPSQRLEADAQQMGKDMETKLIPTTLAGIREVNALLDKVPGAGSRGQKDIPGFGVAQSVMPSWMLSQSGKDMRSAVKSVSNKLLQAQSGLAVTDQENRRFLEQLQQGTFMTDEDFKRGWQRVMSETQARLDNIKGSFHPDIIGEYSKRNPNFTWNVGAPAMAAPTSTANPAADYFK